MKTASVIGIRNDSSSSLVGFLLSLAAPLFHSAQQQLSETVPTTQQNTIGLKRLRKCERQKDENSKTSSNYHQSVSKLRQVVSRQGFAVLDGAMGTELESRGLDVGSNLWSAGILLNEVVVLLCGAAIQ